MDRTKVMALMATILFILCLAAPAGAKFIGTAVGFDKDISGGIDVNVGKIAGLENTAFGGAALDVGVSWDVPINLGVMAGYPYGYGGLGVVTQGTTGYALGLSMDGVSTSGFNGADWGIPLQEQGTTTTHFAKLWAGETNLDNTQALLPSFGFPAL